MVSNLALSAAQDAGVEIVPKTRKVIRREMGSLQKKVYQYHLQAEYRDINGKPAIGAQLQALRIAAADPSSLYLTAQLGGPAESSDCVRGLLELVAGPGIGQEDDVVGQVEGMALGHAFHPSQHHRDGGAISPAPFEEGRLFTPALLADSAIQG